MPRMVRRRHRRRVPVFLRIRPVERTSLSLPSRACPFRPSRRLWSGSSGPSTPSRLRRSASRPRPTWRSSSRAGTGPSCRPPAWPAARARPRSRGTPQPLLLAGGRARCQAGQIAGRAGREPGLCQRQDGQSAPSGGVDAGRVPGHASVYGPVQGPVRLVPSSHERSRRRGGRP